MAAAAGSFLIASCTPRHSYFEPEEPAEIVKPALVSTPSPIYREGKDLILIKEIDGRAPTFLDTKAVVHPGQHSFLVYVELHHDGSSPDESYVTRTEEILTFKVDAEHEYLIDARETRSGLWLWATDKTDQIVVAGHPPRDLPESEQVKPIWKNEGR